MLGFCLPQIWMYVIVQTDNPLPFDAGIAFHGALGSVVLIGAAFYLAKPNLQAPRIIEILLPIAMCLLPLYVILFPTAGEYESVTLFLSLVSGIACAWCFCFWFSLSARAGFKDAICYILLASTLAAISRLIFALLPSALVLVLLIPVALSSISLGKMLFQLSIGTPMKGTDENSHKKSSPDIKRVFDRVSLRQLLPVIIEFACYGVVLGLLRSLSSESQQESSFMTLNYCFRIIVALLLFAWFGLHEKRKSVGRIVQLSLFALIIFFFGFVLLEDRTFPLISTLISFTRGVVLMLLTITALEVAQRLHINPVAAFGIGRGIYEFSTIAGVLLNEQVKAVGYSTTAPLNIILFVIVCFLLVIVNRTMRVIVTFDEENPPPSSNVALADIDDRCDDLAGAYALTEREIEVFKLLCKGRSKSYIAEALSISENTVRHHSKNLYNKLHIHNKQELMSLVGLD